MAGNALLHAAALLEELGVTRGMRVADFGAGRTAHLVFPAARLVGDEGVVFAVDIHPDSLTMIDGHRKLHAQTNLETVWGNIEKYGGVPLPSSSLDLVMIVSTLWQARSHLDIAKEAWRVVRPGGTLAIVDWRLESAHPVAPSVHLRVNHAVVEPAFLHAGWRLSRDISPSPWHWGRVYSS